MSLTTEVTPLGGDRVRLDVAVPQDEVQRQMDRTIRQIGRDVRVPGFRPGKVPAQIVVQRVGREMVVQEMLKASLGAWYATAVAESGVRPIDDPEVDLDDVPEDGGISFTATVTTQPVPELGDYRGLEVGKADPTVPDGMLEQELDRLREQAARLEASEEPAAEGDFVVIDFDGSVDGREIKGASARDHLVELGAGRLLPEFERELAGASTGDERTVEVAYPEDDGRPELAGKTVGYAVTVKGVQRKVVPELDDDVAIQVSEFDTVDELRADVQRRLDESALARVDDLFRGMVIDAAVEAATVEVPEVMVEDRVASIIQSTEERLRGRSLQDLLTARGSDLETWKGELRPEAEMAIKRELVVEAIADAEAIEVSDDEVEDRIRADAEASERDPKELVAEVRKGGAWERLRSDLRLQKAVDLIVEAASPIPMEQAEARKKLWTPESERAEQGKAQLWTPGSGD
jgi:trigger factor